MRQEPVSVLAELVAALAPASGGLVRGIPLSVIEDPKEVNAFAAASRGAERTWGSPRHCSLFTARSAEAKAYDELFGTRKYDEMISGVASEVKAQRAINGPPRGFLPLPGALDPRKLSRQLLLSTSSSGSSSATSWRTTTAVTRAAPTAPRARA